MIGRVIAMGESLKEVKQRLAGKYLGKSGIHGLGVRQSQNAVCVYVDADDNGEQESLLKEIETEAAPYRVLKIAEDRATIT